VAVLGFQNKAIHEKDCGVSEHIVNPYGSCTLGFLMDTASAEQLAWELLKKHRLNNWYFRFDYAKRRFGSCDYRKRTITLSKHLTLLNPKAEVKDTLLHEIAHALTPGDNHGQKWQAKCVELGAKPMRCYELEQVKQPEPGYLLVCTKCRKKYPRYRKTKGIYVCRSCCDRHNEGKPSHKYRLYWLEVSL
jgi:predicted SprT family Zn-dependent metalloprotease